MPRSKTALARYRGPFGYQQAERLLWRAGFGPRSEQEVHDLAAGGMDRAVQGLLNPPSLQLTGPAPTDSDGRPIFPKDAWGQDHVWWLDRMVRSNQPLVERMTLCWHDWFATSVAGSQQNLCVDQNHTLRAHALGNFRDLFLAVTRDPAMLIWLSGSSNSKWSINENYAREMMELFTLGAHSGAYTERDIRQAARALTGFTSKWSASRGSYGFRYRKALHDAGVKRVLGRRGRMGWRDACDACLGHPKHPRFMVSKLWGYFVAAPIPPRDRAALERMYRRHRYAVKPLLQAILTHPLLYEGPRMVKPPAVFQAGMLRALNRPIHETDWAWLGAISGQLLFQPPNVAGWDESRWLDTGTFRGRAQNTAVALAQYKLSDKQQDLPAVPVTDPAALVENARRMLGSPTISPATAQVLQAFAADSITRLADERWKQRTYPVLVENALRQLILLSPDYQTC